MASARRAPHCPCYSQALCASSRPGEPTPWLAQCSLAPGSRQDKAEEGSGSSSLLTHDLGLQERLAST